MAKIFLDTNYFIDAIHRKPEKQILNLLIGHIVYISTLSFHIYCYAYKIKIPAKKILLQKDKFQLVDFSEKILERALNNPTPNLEDNVQLHSAAEAECDIFLTHDQQLLNLRFFGRVKILNNLDKNKS